MNVTLADNEVVVTFSRRNLVSLLAKLDGHPPMSTCTIDRTIDGVALKVIAEEDDAHYGGRAIPPGPMHPDTEEAIR